jgi:hypothetical protein
MENGDKTEISKSGMVGATSTTSTSTDTVLHFFLFLAQTHYSCNNDYSTEDQSTYH